jgi:hypothetical protein
MAKRRSSGKLQPVPLVLNFEIDASTNSTHFIDISQSVSAVSRKFLRQGLNWAIAGGRVIMPPASTPAAGNSCYISTLPHTWSVSNAWEKVFRAWHKQQREAISDGGNQSVKAAFNDFKIFADATHHAAGVAANLLPVNMGPGTGIGPFATALVRTGPVSAGEWEASQIVIPNFGAPGVNYEPYLHMVGDDVGGAGGSVGMVKAYANSRGVPQSPDPAVPGGVISNENFLNTMFDVGDNNEDVMDNVVDKNNDLPYPQINYPGADINFVELENQVTIWNSNTIGQNTYSFAGFSAPCGLLRIDQLYSADGPNKMWVQILLVPGPNRGYLTQPMTEM